MRESKLTDHDYIDRIMLRKISYVLFWGLAVVAGIASVVVASLEVTK